MWISSRLFFFFFNDTATTEIYTLSLHDALPISLAPSFDHVGPMARSVDECGAMLEALAPGFERDRKSTRLNSSHLGISYAVFCLKKKKKKKNTNTHHKQNIYISTSINSHNCCSR